MGTYKAKESENESDDFVYCPEFNANVELKTLMQSYKRKTDAQYDKSKAKEDLIFERKQIKDVIHTLTSELKQRAAQLPLLMLPFRPDQIDDEGQLVNLLASILPKNGKPMPTDIVDRAIKSTENVHLLMAALKYIWCRLPGNAIIGWKVYIKFVKMEEEAHFPKKAFLEFMPSCLNSGAHASIVYDFFDLLVAFIINSKRNLMTAKKLSRMCGLWAFNPIRNAPAGEPSFERGLYEWIPAGDAMFHLLLSFLKAMPPDGDISKLPSSFQSLLRNSEYPPSSTSSKLDNMKNLMDVPLITLKVNNPSKNPAELISKVGKTLKFDNSALFKNREDYLLLKRIFKDPSEINKKLSTEGRRILENLCLHEDQGEFCNGWSKTMTKTHELKSQLPDFFSASIGRLAIDDYFIWTWLASLGYEENDLKRRTFGKSYIMEVELAEGFKKWVIIEEQDLERDGYDIELELKQERLKELEAKIHQAERKILEPPTPLPKDFAIPPRSKDRQTNDEDYDDALNKKMIKLQHDYSNGKFEDVNLSLKDSLSDDFFGNNLEDEFKDLRLNTNTEQRAREKESLERRQKKEVEEKAELVRMQKLREAKEKGLREKQRLLDLKEEQLRKAELERKREEQAKRKQLEEAKEKELREREIRLKERRERDRLKAIKEQEAKERRAIELREQELIERERQLLLKEQQLKLQEQRSRSQISVENVQQVQGPNKQYSPENSSRRAHYRQESPDYFSPNRTQSPQYRQHSPEHPPLNMQYTQQTPEQIRTLEPDRNIQQKTPNSHSQPLPQQIHQPQQAPYNRNLQSPEYPVGKNYRTPQGAMSPEYQQLRSQGAYSQLPPLTQPMGFPMSHPIKSPANPHTGSPMGSPMGPSANGRYGAPRYGSPQGPVSGNLSPMVGRGSGVANGMNNGYSSNVIAHMPIAGRVDKKTAREAFMGGDFGI